MKIETKSFTPTPVPPPFYPKEIKLTFETQDELNQFGRLFNYSPVNEASTVVEKMRLWEVAKTLGADIGGTDDIAKFIKRRLGIFS